MFERTLSKGLSKISKLFPVTLLTGMRQVGKSTLFEMLNTAKYKYVSLDNVEDKKLAINNPSLFLDRYSPPVIIDEVQYAPELFPYIKLYVDKNKKNGQFLLTGSQKFNLMKGVKESLAGRVAIIDMLGFSYKEMKNNANEVMPFLPSMSKKTFSKIADNLTLFDIYKIIFNGSFPRLIVNKGKGRDIFFKSYIKTYIERDVRDFDGITDDIKFYNFIRAVAVRTGNLLNYSDIARDVGIDNRTAKQWLAILERSGVIKLLYPYYNNVTNRIIKTPKVYFLDTGLCVYLAGIDDYKTLEASYLTGAIFETYCFTEILKSYWHNGLEANIYFYRDADQREIDFVIEKNNILYPVEVKKTKNPSFRDAKNFELLKHLKKEIGTGAILCLRQDITPISDNVVSVPAWTIA
ncbi:MAG: ATP-binding protein [Bacteroidales bacterium]|jgi:predicted AAA+ superfamily ATPase|nr:ATP-binding protein [Bacteroidales bacterium]